MADNVYNPILHRTFRTIEGDDSVHTLVAHISGEYAEGGATVAKQNESIIIETAIQAATEAIQAAVATEAKQDDQIVLETAIAAAASAMASILTALGQAAMAASLPVAIASDQSDVPVTLDGEVIGVAEETKAITPVTGTKSASGDNELIAAPGAGNRLVVYYWKVQLEAEVETTMILKDGSTERYRHFATAKEGGEVKTYAPGREWRLAENSPLIINLSAANQVGYNIEYAIEEVI